MAKGRPPSKYGRLTHHGKQIIFTVPAPIGRSLEPALGHLFEVVVMSDGVKFVHIQQPVVEETVPPAAWVERISGAKEETDEATG